MKQKYIFGLVIVLTFIVVVIISWRKLQPYEEGLFGDNNILFETNVYTDKVTESDTINISIADLPYSVKDVIRKDSLINSLKIKAIKKISQRNNEFYDVCFKATDYFNILILYDENGTVVYH
jgi:hypothetical protein